MNKEKLTGNQLSGVDEGKNQINCLEYKVEKSIQSESFKKKKNQETRRKIRILKMKIG